MKKNDPFLEYQEQVKSALGQVEAFISGEEWSSRDLESVYHGTDNQGTPIENVVQYFISSKLSDSKGVQFDELVAAFLFCFQKLPLKYRISDQAKNLSLRDFKSLASTLKDLEEYLEAVSTEIEERDKNARRWYEIVSPYGTETQNQKTNHSSKPKRGRRPKADLKSRSNRELLIAILLKHHRYESKDGLKIDPISTKEACKDLGKSESTLSKTWEKVQPTLTYEKYVQLCGHFKTLEKFLKAIDSKEGYLERSNKEESIDRSEG